MFDSITNYRHTKTGNIYEFLTEVFPTENVPSRFISCLAVTCSETKLKVTVYFEDNKWYYVPKHNPDIHENTAIKVLYERDGILWFRSKTMFHELVTINGEQKPRFERVEDENATDSQRINTISTS